MQWWSIEAESPGSWRQMSKVEKRRGSSKSCPASRKTVLITGTPGTGKSLLVSKCKDAFKRGRLQSVNVSDLVKDEGLHDGYDKEFDTYIINDAKTRRRLYRLIKDENVELPLLIECHSCELFSHRKLLPLIQHVIVLTASTECLYDRLTERGYSARKREENLDCEIMNVCAMEADDIFGVQKVQRLVSCTEADLQAAVDVVTALLK